jgi:hypothetical protein
MSVLAERLIAVHSALGDAALPHAFGGAIALAYCTQEPRGTRDLDVNVFVGIERADDVLGAMPDGVSIRRIDRTALHRDGQVRLMWEETPVDLFLDTHAFHRRAAGDIIEVPFENAMIPVLGCETLLVFKAMFNRTRDWADIEAMLDAGAVDGARALETLQSLLGADDPSVIRLRALLR